MTATERPSDLLPPRWYMVNNFGAATLCVDQKDAMKIARASDRLFPRDAPHVAVQLAPARTIDAAPADPVVSAGCWRRAIAEAAMEPMNDAEWSPIEQRAIELAKENMHGT
jgi:hypothetical protein